MWATWKTMTSVMVLMATGAMAVGAETGRHDSPETALPLEPGATAEGVWHFGDQSQYYHLKLPGTGTASVELSGFPEDCSFQVNVFGFQKATTALVESIDGKPGRNVSARFTTQAGCDGYVAVRLSNIVSSVSTNDWSAVRCTPVGPWHLCPKVGQPAPKAPDRHEGAPVLPPITYRLVVNSAADGPSSGPGGGVKDPEKPTIKAGPETSAGEANIGPTGGDVLIKKPGDPLDGLKITVPPGAYGGEHHFEVSHRPITGHTLGQHFHPVSPLVTVKSGGDYAQKTMTIRIPARVPDGHFALAFFFDPATGELEGLPLVKLEADAVTCLTRHFSTIVVSSIDKKELTQATVDTGFAPGKDDWQFSNDGTFFTPYGECAGMCLSALWYWCEKGRHNPSRRLYGLYDNDGLGFRTPGFGYDDTLGQRLTSVLQKELDFDNLLADAFFHMGQISPTLVQCSFTYSMLLTKQPQLVGLLRKGGGHAVIAYKLSGNTLSVADPIFPGKSNSLREVVFESGRFKPYSSAANTRELARGEGRSYDTILYMAKSALLPWPQAAARWRELETGTIGSTAFPALRILQQTAPGKTEELKDDAVTDKPQIELSIAVDGPFALPDFRIYRFRNDKWTPWEKGGRVDLEPGVNKLGIYAFYWSQEKPPDRLWAAFRWIDVNYFTLLIDPPKQETVVGQTVQFTARSTNIISVEAPRYEWMFEDGKQYEKTTEPTHKHSYSKPGTYTVIARLYHNVTNELLSDGRATVIVKPGASTPPSSPPPADSGKIVVSITSNVPDLTNKAIGAGAKLGGARDTPYRFVATVSGLPAGAKPTYRWTCTGGGNIRPEQNACQASFPSAGSYEMTVTVVDEASGQVLGTGTATARIR